MADSTDNNNNASNAAADESSVATTTPTSSTAAKSKKGKNAPKAKPTFGKTAFKLPVTLERALRYVAFLQEDSPNLPSTAQEILEDAVTRHIEYLKKKGIVFPEAILPAAE
jgi:hypothetical protein